MYVQTYPCPDRECAADNQFFKIAVPAKQGFPNYWPVSGDSTDPRVAFVFQNFVIS
jgi:hypothetical protein